MTIFISVSAALLLISIILYLVFIKKNNEKITKITTSLQLPFTALLSISSLALFLPDSLHLIIFTALAFVLCSASVILFFYESNIYCKVLARTLFLLSAVTWFNLFKSTFFIYKIPLVLFIVSIVVYIGLFTGTCLFLGKQKISRYFWAFISIVICSLLHFCAVVTLFESKQLYSIFLFLGTTGIFALDIRYLFLYKMEQKKHSRHFQSILLLLSQMLISLSCYLMIC